MFKRGDRITHNDYGTGEVWSIKPNRKISFPGRTEKIVVTGYIEVAFDSEMGENNGNGKQKTQTFLLDGRGVPEGSGYFSYGEFIEYGSYIELTKI